MEKDSRRAMLKSRAKLAMTAIARESALTAMSLFSRRISPAIYKGLPYLAVPFWVRHQVSSSFRRAGWYRHPPTLHQGYDVESTGHWTKGTLVKLVSLDTEDARERALGRGQSYGEQGKSGGGSPPSTSEESVCLWLSMFRDACLGSR
jgi:hypothetical protein